MLSLMLQLQQLKKTNVELANKLDSTMKEKKEVQKALNKAEGKLRKQKKKTCAQDEMPEDEV